MPISESNEWCPEQTSLPQRSMVDLTRASTVSLACGNHCMISLSPNLGASSWNCPLTCAICAKKSSKTRLCLCSASFAEGLRFFRFAIRTVTRLKTQQISTRVYISGEGWKITRTLGGGQEPVSWFLPRRKGSICSANRGQKITARWFLIPSEGERHSILEKFPHFSLDLLFRVWHFRSGSSCLRAIPNRSERRFDIVSD